MNPGLRSGTFSMDSKNHSPVFIDAFTYSVPVMLGYLVIGIAFGLLLSNAGYPWWLALVMSAVMYAGAGQYLAVGLFAAGAGLADVLIMQFVLNARHIAYSFSMLKKFNAAGKYKWYLVFALTDETFALLSSLPDAHEHDKQKSRFMFYTALLDHLYWISGSVAGALAGTFIPFDMAGIRFSLTALFIVLMIEQMKKAKRGLPFAVAVPVTVVVSLFFPGKYSLLAAMILSLALVQMLDKAGRGKAC